MPEHRSDEGKLRDRIAELEAALRAIVNDYDRDDMPTLDHNIGLAPKALER
jgi:hypothetical protein